MRIKLFLILSFVISVAFSPQVFGMVDYGLGGGTGSDGTIPPADDPISPADDPNFDKWDRWEDIDWDSILNGSAILSENDGQTQNVDQGTTFEWSDSTAGPTAEIYADYSPPTDNHDYRISTDLDLDESLLRKVATEVTQVLHLVPNLNIPDNPDGGPDLSFTVKANEDTADNPNDYIVSLDGESSGVDWQYTGVFSIDTINPDNPTVKFQKHQFTDIPVSLNLDDLQLPDEVPDDVEGIITGSKGGTVDVTMTYGTDGTVTTTAEYTLDGGKITVKKEGQGMAVEGLPVTEVSLTQGTLPEPGYMQFSYDATTGNFDYLKITDKNPSTNGFTLNIKREIGRTQEDGSYNILTYDKVMTLDSGGRLIAEEYQNAQLNSQEVSIKEVYFLDGDGHLQLQEDGEKVQEGQLVIGSNGEIYDFDTLQSLSADTNFIPKEVVDDAVRMLGVQQFGTVGRFTLGLLEYNPAGLGKFITFGRVSNSDGVKTPTDMFSFAPEVNQAVGGIQSGDYVISVEFGEGLASALQVALQKYSEASGSDVTQYEDIVNSAKESSNLEVVLSQDSEHQLLYMHYGPAEGGYYLWYGNYREEENLPYRDSYEVMVRDDSVIIQIGQQALLSTTNETRYFDIGDYQIHIYGQDGKELQTLTVENHGYQDEDSDGICEIQTVGRVIKEFHVPVKNAYGLEVSRQEITNLQVNLANREYVSHLEEFDSEGRKIYQRDRVAHLLTTEILNPVFEDGEDDSYIFLYDEKGNIAKQIHVAGTFSFNHTYYNSKGKIKYDVTVYVDDKRVAEADFVQDPTGDWKLLWNQTRSTGAGGVRLSGRGGGGGGRGGGGGGPTNNGGITPPYSGENFLNTINSFLDEIPIGKKGDKMIDWLVKNDILDHETADAWKSLTAKDGQKIFLAEVKPDASADDVRRGILTGLGLDDEVVNTALSKLGDKDSFIEYMSSVLMESLGLSEEEARKKAELLYILLTNIGSSGFDIRTYLEKLGYTSQEIDEFIAKLQEMKESKREYLASLGIDEDMIEQILMLDKESAQEVLEDLGLSDEQIAEFFALEDEIKDYLKDKMGILEEDIIEQILTLDEEQARAFLENRSLDIDIDEFLALESDEEKLEYLKNYFMNEKGMSEEEATQRAQEIMDEIGNLAENGDGSYNLVNELFELIEDNNLSEWLVSYLESLGFTSEEIDELAKMLADADGDKFLSGFGLTEDEILKYRYLRDEETGKAYAQLKVITDYYVDLLSKNFPDVSEEEIKENAEFIAKTIAGIDEDLNPVGKELFSDLKKWWCEVGEEVGLDKEGLNEMIGGNNTSSFSDQEEDQHHIRHEEVVYDNRYISWHKEQKTVGGEDDTTYYHEKTGEDYSQEQEKIKEALREIAESLVKGLFEGKYLPLNEESVKEYAKSVMEEIKGNINPSDGEGSNLPENPPSPEDWGYDVAPWEYDLYVNQGIDTKEKFFEYYKNYFEDVDQYNAWMQSWEDWLELHLSGAVYI